MADEFAKKVLEKVQAYGANIWRQICSTEDRHVKLNCLNVLLSSTIGVMSFPFCLAVFQSAVFRPLRITSNRRIIGLLSGSVSVAMAGSTASLVFLSSAILYKEIEDSTGKPFANHLDSLLKRFPSVAVAVSSRDIPLYSFASLALFKLLGGRFHAVLPSSLIHPGAFGRAFIPAKGQNYASEIAKKTLTSLGRKYGCHSCGRRRRTSFVGDHMPPNKLAKANQSQKFYPQCTRCSNQQGAALSSMSKHLAVRTHGSSLRLYHLWIPLPIPLALIRNYVSEKEQVTHASEMSNVDSKRFYSFLQGIIKDALVLLRLKKKDSDKSNYDDGKE